MRAQKIRKQDIKFETMRGSGPGGQHKNKTDSCVRATHIPTGLVVTIDGRKQGQNKREAVRALQVLLDQRKFDRHMERKKAHRDKAIQERNIIRTYHYPRNQVKDHRSGKTASIKQVVDKGRIDLLRGDLPCSDTDPSQ